MNQCFSPIFRPLFPVWPITCSLTYLYSLIEIPLSRQRFSQLVFFLIIHLNYFSYGWLLYCLKHWLQDHRCMGKPNSISGHTFFNIYFAFLFYYSLFYLNKNKNFLQTFFLMIIELLQALSIILTYVGGYHTIKQMIYGFFFPIFPITQMYLFSKFSQKQQLLYHSAIYFLFLVLGLSTTQSPPSFPLYTLPSLLFFGACIFTSTIIKPQNEEKPQEMEDPSPVFQNKSTLFDYEEENIKFENI